LVFFTIQLSTLSSPTVIGEPYYIAKNLTEGSGYSSLYPYATVSAIHSYIAPLYSGILSIIFFCGGDIIASQILNLIFLHIAYGIMFLFFRKITSLKVSFLGFVALQCYIPLWLLAECIDANALNILLIAVTISILYSLSENSSAKKWLVLGTVTGLQLLVRPDMIIGIIFFLPWIVWQMKKGSSRRKLLRDISISILIAIAIVLPWTIRNAVVFHSFIPISANGGYNLYMGNNPTASGELWQLQETSESLFEKEHIEHYSKDHSQPELDAMLFHLAINWIADHPKDAIVLGFKKIYYHWFGREHGTARPEFSMYHNIYNYFNIFLVFVGLFGLFLIKDKKASSLLGILFLYSTVVSAIFFVQSRHKMIKVDPFLIPLAVYSVVYTAKRVGQKLLPKENV
jgi:hypothetical protein